MSPRRFESTSERLAELVCQAYACGHTRKPGEGDAGEARPPLTQYEGQSTFPHAGCYPNALWPLSSPTHLTIYNPRCSGRPSVGSVSFAARPGRHGAHGVHVFGWDRFDDGGLDAFTIKDFISFIRALYPKDGAPI